MGTSFGISLGFTSTVTVSMLPFLIYVCFASFSNKINWKSTSNQSEYGIIILGIFILVIKFLIGQNYIRDVVSYIFLPMIFSISLKNISTAEHKILLYLMLLFYICECGLAIGERITLTNIYDTDIFEESVWDTPEDWEFRSTALLGHPLMNAMIVAVMLIFIISSTHIPLFAKYIFFLSGFFAILSFNARGATIVTAFTATLLLIKQTLAATHNKKRKLTIIILLILSAIVIVRYILNSGFGGRLINAGSLVDGSSMTRIEVLKFYQHVDFTSLFWGSPANYKHVMQQLGAGGVENGIIVMLLNYGIIFAVLLLLMLIRFHWKKLQQVVPLNKWLIFITFYIIGTMNPNLASSLPWTIWILSYYAFIKLPNNDQSYHKKRLRLLSRHAQFSLAND